MKKIIFKLLLIFIISSNFITAQTVQRRVLFEDFTSCTCPPCATNNPYLEAFVTAHPDSIVTVSYHMGWPSPGNDPMYLYNTSQNYDRRYYYGVNSIPYLKIAGLYFTQNYTNVYNMLTPYSIILGTPTPLTISVTDTRLPGDTIKADIVVTNLSALPTGTYYLRVMSVEKRITYSSPPGTNGEMIFPNVFRKSIPSSTGTSLLTAAGTYNFTFKYKIDTLVCKKDQMFTVAFVQNDVGQEVLNVAGKLSLTGISPITEIIPKEYKLEQNYPNPFNPVTKIGFSLPNDGYVTLKVFDVLGREVANLVNNEFVKAGTYKSEFNGSELSSGLYFYKLTTSKFTDTKKMILTK